MNNSSILDTVFQSWHTSVITTACRLGVFSRLDVRRMSAEDLARDTDCIPHLLEALLDACVAIGLLRREKGVYFNSHESGAYLVEGRPLYVGHILEVLDREAARWNQLYDLLKIGVAPTVANDVDERDPVFTLAMNDLGAHSEAEALAAAVDLSDCRTLLDVGCGSGIYAITLCRHFPQIAATLIDREQVLRTTKAMIDASGLAERIRMRPDDMTSGAIPGQVDAVLLSDALYFDPPISLSILDSVHAALNPGGNLIIRGYYHDPGGSGSPFGAIFRLKLLLSNPERTPPTVDDISDQLAKVGFRNIRSFILTERSSCIVANK